MNKKKDAGKNIFNGEYKLATLNMINRNRVPSLKQAYVTFTQAFFNLNRDIFNRMSGTKKCHG